VNAVAELPRDDDSPPPSGVRLRAPAVARVTTGRDPSSPLARPAPVRGTEPDDFVEALALVGDEVVFETWAVVRALSPLQGGWLKLGLAQLGAAVLTVGPWRCREPRVTAKVLRERWPELVPGAAAMDGLAELMVDAIC
jgi:hypothetical protein